MTRFRRICAMVVIARGYLAGQRVPELARLSGLSSSTVYRYLKLASIKR